METPLVIICFWSMLVSAVTFIIVGEKQAANPPPTNEKPPQVMQSDAGGWKKSSDGKTEVRVYWDK